MTAGEAGGYIFVVTPDREPGGGIARTAREVLTVRAAAGLWPLGTSGAFLRRIAAGDPILFYAGGKGDPDQSTCFAVGDVAGASVLRDAEDHADGTAEAFVRRWRPSQHFLPIRRVELIEPVPIRPLVPALGFITQKRNWSAHVAGAFHRLPAPDRARVLA